MIDQYVGTAEVASCLKVKQTKANDIMWMFRQRGQAYKIGKLWRVKEKDFKAWLETECKQERKIAR